MDYSKLKVAQLKEELLKRNLSPSGLKNDMINRLKEADRMYNESARRPPVSELIKSSSVPHSDDPLEFVHQESHVETREKRKKDREERAMITLWRKPLTTLQYFFFELCIMLVGWIHRLWLNKRRVLICLVLALCVFIAIHLDGPHQKFITKFRTDFGWCSYWVILGIMSSVGLGTGLHTFLLYLGPFIASVTLAAFECMSVDFPEPPFPDEIICPDVKGDSMSIWVVLSKVRVAACMWGAGTAIGELPPYFMAKAARLSGEEPDDEDYEEFEDILEHEQDANKDFGTRAKLFMQKLVHQAGFLGIMACASIPNPLFDLAGITCGHFLVPFWTFFGATLIGKAIIKVHIQQLFVIIAFSEHHVEMVVDLIGKIPYVGQLLQAPFRESLAKQKEKLHTKGGTQASQNPSWLSWLFEKLIIAMVVYFVLSIINSMAQRYAKRLQDKEKRI